MKRWRDCIVNRNINSFELGNIWSIDNNLSQIVNEIILEINHIEFDCIAGIETKGIIFASALSSKTGKPLIVFRKKGKITYTDQIIQERFINWKSNEDGLEIEEYELNTKRKILIVDDVSQSLSTFKAVKKIINKSNSEIVGFFCIANLSTTNVIDNIRILSLINQEN
jgi:adenine phosphoribosyltransferase